MGELLRTEDLSVSFSGFWALDGVNFSVGEGELRVVIGPNGAGKTTLMDLITGRTRPTRGTVVFAGKDITGRPPHEIARRCGIGRKFQGPNLFENMTALQNLELAVPCREGAARQLFHRVTGAERLQARGVLERIGLAGRESLLAGELSHGQRQWLEIGMLMMQAPRLMILDEPTAGMTSEETRLTGELVRGLLADHTVLVVEHDMEFVRQVAQTVTVLHMGKVLAEGPLTQIERDPEVIRVYLKSSRKEADALCSSSTM